MSLGRAMRLCYEGRTTQQKIAEKLKVNQNTVSRWVNGKQTPKFEQIRSFELACQRPAGTVYRAMGLVEDPTDVSPEWAVQNDLTLPPETVSTLLGVLRAARQGQPRQ